MTIEFVEYVADQTHDDYSPGDKQSVFGGEADTFGAELTAAEVNDSSFSVIFDADVGSGILRVDEVTVEVFFTLPIGQYDPDGLPNYAASGLVAGCVGLKSQNEKRLVVVGAKGAIKTSDDLGATWDDRVSGVAETLRGVTYGDDGFIAVGDGGVVLSSANGSAWTTEETMTTDPLLTILYDEQAKRYLAGGRNGVVRTRSLSQPWQVKRN
jgi:photosystem II stability/assembly factor-like uncharacterized protein